MHCWLSIVIFATRYNDSVAGTRCDLDDKGKLENDWYFYNSSDNFPLPCLAWPHISSSCRDRLPQVPGHMEGMHVYTH